jgi:hypothetical protein
MRRQIGDKRGVAIALGNLGYVALVDGNNAAAYEWTEQSLSLFRELGHRLGLVWVLENMGLASLAQGDSDAAQRFLREGLSLCRVIGERRSAMNYLIVFSGTVVVQPGQEAKAAQIAGAAEALQVATESVIDLAERRVYENTIAAAKTALGEEAFNAAFEAGKQMSLDEAVQLTLPEQ